MSLVLAEGDYRTKQVGRDQNGNAITAIYYSTSGVVPPSSINLLITGPTTLQEGVASAPFVISADFLPADPVVITPRVSGAMTVTPTSVTLSAINPTPSFTLTPIFSGPYQVDLPNNGSLNTTFYDFEVVGTLPPPNDVSAKWHVDVNPARPFAGSQGLVPSGIPTKSGDNKIRAQATDCVTAKISCQRDLHVLTYPDVTSTAIPFGSTLNVDPLHEWLRRVPDPDDGAKWAYHHRVNKNAYGWVPVTGQKFRSEVTSINNTRYTPHGEESWSAFAIRLPAYWRSLKPTVGGDFLTNAQFHAGSGSMVANPSVALSLEGGDTRPENACWHLKVRSYLGPYGTANQKVEDYYFNYNAPTEVWHWFIFHFVTGCGNGNGSGYEGQDPLGPIYGYSDPDQVFLKLYHAIGSGNPYLAVSRKGFWAYPYKETNVFRATKGGYWKTGLYGKQNNGPWEVSDERYVWTKGNRQYLARRFNEPTYDIPNMTVFDVLRDFRGF